MSCLVKSLQPDFVKKKQINTRPYRQDVYQMDIILVILTLCANYSFSCRYRRVFYLWVRREKWPTLIAVTSMRCVAIRLDRTHARVKQDLQAMAKHAPVSCYGNVKNYFQNDLNVILCPSICYIRSVQEKMSRKKKKKKKQKWTWHKWYKVSIQVKQNKTSLKEVAENNQI